MALNDLNLSSQRNSITKKYIVPLRVIASENADAPELLLCDTPLQPTLGVNQVCTIREGGYVILDFGSELQGGINITTNRVMGKDQASEYCFYGKMRLVFGESVSETLSHIGVKCAQNDHAVRDMTVTVSGLSSARHGNTGFRFVKIEAVEGSLELNSVKGVLEYKEIEYKGSFVCNDARLNAVFDTAAYTVHLNMQDYIWDGIKRDRLVWIGDLHPEVSTVCSVFGYDDSVEKSLDFARDTYPINDENNGIWMVFPSYSCWWIIIHRDWYMQNGRLDYLLGQKEYMYKLCESLLARIYDDGTLDFGGNYFVDWSSADTPFREAGFRGCLVLGLRAAAEIFEAYGDPEMQNKCLVAAENVKKILPEFSGNKQVTAMAALGGLCDINEAEGIITKDLLTGLSTFYGYYVLQALAKAGNIQAAIDIMRDYWGAMIDHGATSFWEDFDIEWTRNAGRIDEIPTADKVDIHGTYGKHCYKKLRLSLCHGWAGGPADFIAKNILGVEILEAGCRKIRVAPNLGDLSWVRGTYPTPYGVIKIEHKKENGSIDTKIDAPAEIEIVNE